MANGNFIVTTALKKCLKLTARKKVIQGGTSASKTYSIIPILIDYATKNPRHLITVVAESIPAVRNGAVKIFQDVMYDTNRWIQDHWRSNPMEYKFSNGATIQFTSFDNAGKAKAAGKRDILFLNEANHINFDIADALMVRSNSIWIDFNPDHEFWAHTETLKEPDSEFLLLTYKDNEGLPPEILQELLIRQEKAKTNEYWANWCKVYIDGEIGVIQGAIFQNWSIGEFDNSLPHVYGLDFGFSCFVADTLITTDKGQKRIADINIGDLVLTQNGFNKVLKVHNNGVKKVVEKNIEIDFGLINISCTLEHNFKANNEWKQFKNLQSKDILTTNVISMEKNIKDIQTENIQTISTIKNLLVQKVLLKHLLKYFTLKCGNILKVIFQMVFTFTISTIIHLIILLKTLIVYPVQTTLKYIKVLMATKIEKEIQEALHTQKKIGQVGEQKVLRQFKKKIEYVVLAVANILQQIHIKNIAKRNVYEKQCLLTLNIIKKQIVSFVQKSLTKTNILNKKPAVHSAHIHCQEIKEIKVVREYEAEVFDLTIENEHNYFANGILVHNCDPDSLIKVAVDKKRKLIYASEVLYKTGNSTEQLIDILNNRLQPLKSVVVADSADPRTINDIRQNGLNIYPARKGPDSVRNGIKRIQDYEIIVEENSLNLLTELRNYIWHDKRSQVPIDAYNHQIDPLRYAFDYLTQSALLISK